MNCTEILLQMQSRCFVFISEFIQSDIQQSAVCPKGGGLDCISCSDNKVPPRQFISVPTYNLSSVSTVQALTRATSTPGPEDSSFLRAVENTRSRTRSSNHYASRVQTGHVKALD